MKIFFDVLFHTLFGWLGLPVLGLIVAVYFVSWSGWGKKAGVARLCVGGYILYLVFLYAVGAAQGPESLGYGWLPLLACTLPWSFLFDPIAGQGLHVDGPAGMVLNFALLVCVYGGMNSLIVLGVVWASKPKNGSQKVPTGTP